MSNLFGIIVAGRAIQTNFGQTGENEFVVELPNSESINHIVVFLTGIQLFPGGFGGSVYIQWPNDRGETNWHYLGFISNNKPSAIFKIAQLANHRSDNPDSLFTGSALVTMGSVMLGIIAEPLNVIESRTPAVGTLASNQSTITQFAQKMTANLVDHLTSYVVRLPDPNNPNVFGDFVPFRAIQSWYSSFEKRLQANPNFWKFLQ